MSGDPAEPIDDSDRLKPCPFCGGAAEIEIATEAGDCAYVVCCQTCMASSKLIYALMDDVSPLLLEAWNRRTPQPKEGQ